ncbi:hypothetical protein [Lelliottia amnigena]|uniref:hypothetical protein n=1 Tax=Lelliottia amnigena TaxID=61646 RepID=UPI0013F1495E|nr:hypothetical protein [Lelliottia amnigena]
MQLLSALTAEVIGGTGLSVLALSCVPAADGANPVGCAVVNTTSIVLAVGLEAAL